MSFVRANLKPKEEMIITQIGIYGMAAARLERGDRGGSLLGGGSVTWYETPSSDELQRAGELRKQIDDLRKNLADARYERKRENIDGHLYWKERMIDEENF